MSERCRGFASVALCLALAGCGSNPPAEKKAAAEPVAAEKVKITQFYSPSPLVPRGLHGQLCYGVENASKVEINPPVEEVWPSPARCFDITPKQKTTFTLTAYGANGSRDSKSVLITVGSAPPKLYDLSVNSTQVKPGDLVVVCFKADNAKSIKAGPGHLDRDRNCLSDNPKKTTTYRIVALGGDNEQDSGTVTVHVR